MSRPSIKFKKGKVAPLDPAVVKLVDALARLLAREDDATGKSGPQSPWRRKPQRLPRVRVFSQPCWFDACNEQNSVKVVNRRDN